MLSRKPNPCSRMSGGIAESRRFAESGGVRRPRPTTPHRTVRRTTSKNRPDCIDPAWPVSSRRRAGPAPSRLRPPLSMKSILHAALVFSIAVVGYEARAAPSLVWSDEFNQAAGSVPDPSKWTYDLGGGGWGNQELEVYTNAAANACIVADPDATDGKALAITAILTASGGYTSARLKTEGLFTTTFGRVE